MNRLLLSLVLLAGSALAAEPTNTRNPPAATTTTNSVLCTNENLTNATISGIDVKARTVILACGVAWRRLEVEGFDRLAGKGVFYGASRLFGIAEARDFLKRFLRR